MARAPTTQRCSAVSNSQIKPENDTQSQSVRFVTFGCKANQYDTQVLRETLRRRGWSESAKGAIQTPNVVVVNTCTVTAEAGRKARQLIRRIGREQPDARVASEQCSGARGGHGVAVNLLSRRQDLRAVCHYQGSILVYLFFAKISELFFYVVGIADARHRHTYPEVLRPPFPRDAPGDTEFVGVGVS